MPILSMLGLTVIVVFLFFSIGTLVRVIPNQNINRDDRFYIVMWFVFTATQSLPEAVKYLADITGWVAS